MVKKERKDNILGDPPSLECYSTREMQGQVHQKKTGVRVQAEILRVHYEGNRRFNELAQDNLIEPKLKKPTTFACCLCDCEGGVF